MDLSNYRREFTQKPLRARDLPTHPFPLFQTWLQQAEQAYGLDCNAMVLASVDACKQPYQRIVLLKEAQPDYLVFYTNLQSRKAQHIAHHAQVSVLFPWHLIDRQVSFTGEAIEIDAQQACEYFQSRPRASQLSAWVSHQSSPISTRQVLEDKFDQLQQQYAQVDNIPKPDFWGGYRIVFDSVEFWQGGQRRLHDRFLYQQNQDCAWHCTRLSP